VLESMGSDVFVYFTKDFGSEVNAAELQELAQDSGSADTGASGDTLTARLDTETTAREGHESELWADLKSMHVFNPATGANITLEDGSDGPVTGGTSAAASAAGSERGSTSSAATTASDAPAGPGTGAI
jgi:hypothetical protein